MGLLVHTFSIHLSLVTVPMGNLRHNRIWPKVEVVLGILTIGETAGGEGSTVRQFKKFSVTLLRLEITQKQLQIKSTHIFNHSESIKEAGI